MIRAQSFFITMISMVMMPSLAGWAADLPYVRRTKPYNGVNSTVRGDTRTVGMAGATLGLGDTFLAAKDNPAGLAMTMRIGDDNFTQTKVYDEQVQDFDHPVDTFNAGLALVTYPWAFSLGYLRPYREQDVYNLAGFPGQPARLDLSIHEVRASAARTLMDNRLSLGLSLNFGWATREIQFLNAPAAEVGDTSFALGATAGAMLQLPHRLLFGISLSTPMNHEENREAQARSPIPGFFQPVRQPWSGGVGLGWIPNRFFRADLSLFVFGTTTDSALLRDERALVGETFTLQPRLGFAYVYCDFRNLKGTFFSGIYQETSRIDGLASRFHGTGGTEVKPWIFTLGFGMDVAPGYRNAFGSLNIDVFKTLEQLSLIPSDPTPRNGLFTSPFFETDVGLARPLVAEAVPDPNAIDPIRTGLDLPKKLGDGTVKKVLEDAVSLPDKLGAEFEEMKKAQKRRLNKEETPARNAKPVPGSPRKPVQPRLRKKKAADPKANRSSYQE